MKKMLVKIPNNNIQERKYIVEIIINEFLGVDFKMEIVENTANYEIILGNGAKLIIKDNFFSQFKADLEYLQEKNIPQNINFANNKFVGTANMPILFGIDEIVESKDEIICNIDIFASSFFMLTRWEEYVNKMRDKHNRFKGLEHLSYKQNFYNRPIVNEYAEFFWNILKYLDNSIERTERKYEVILSHDVDKLRRYKDFFVFLRALAGDLINRKSLKCFFDTIGQYYNILQGKEKDPYDTFDYLIGISEKYNLVSRFYFIPAKNFNKYDFNYNLFSTKCFKTITNIKRSGHIIGVHPSCKSSNSKKQFFDEVFKIKQIDNSVNEGRMHYLMFENPITWQLWEDNSMQIDSTMGFDFDGGFRCGCCYEYSTFNIITRKKLKLKESPLIAMEGAVKNAVKSPQEFVNRFAELSKIVKKHNGNFVILWHNSSFSVKEWQGYGEKYEEIIKLVTN